MSKQQTPTAPPCTEHDRFAEVIWWKGRATAFLFDLMDRGGDVNEPKRPDDEGDDEAK